MEVRNGAMLNSQGDYSPLSNCTEFGCSAKGATRAGHFGCPKSGVAQSGTTPGWSLNGLQVRSQQTQPTEQLNTPGQEWQILGELELPKGAAAEQKIPMEIPFSRPVDR